MEKFREATVSQQVKALMYTSKQEKQKLAVMTSVPDTQEATAAQIVADIQVTATITQPNDDQEMAEKNRFKRLNMQVSSSPTPTINLDGSYLE